MPSAITSHHPARPRGACMACWEAYHQGVKRRCRRARYIVIENQHVLRPKKTVMCMPCMQRFVAKGWARVIAQLVIGGRR